MHKRHISATLALSFLLTSPATAQTLTDTIRAELDRIGNTPTGCSAVFERLKTLRREHPQLYYFFAARKDDAPSGMCGCGVGYHTDIATAKARAMTGCKKWEVEYGTDGGTKVCAFKK